MTGRSPLLLLLLLALPFAAEAARVHRCVSAEGTPVFADRPCHVLGHHEPTRAPSAPPAPATRPELPPLPPGLCPAPDPVRLRAALAAAFERGRLNDLAALYDWVGRGKAESIVVMNRLAWLLRHRLVEIGFVPPIPDHAWPEDASRLPDLRLALAAPGAEDEEGDFEAFFRLRRHAGCLWLTD